MELLAILAFLGVLALPIMVVVALRRLSRILRRLDDLESLVCEQSRSFNKSPRTSSPPVPTPSVVVSAVAPLPPFVPERVASLPSVVSPVPPPLPVQVTPSALLPVQPAQLPPTIRSPKAEPFIEDVVSSGDTLAGRLLQKAWNWLIVGEEFRRPDVSAESTIAAVWLIRVGITFLVCIVGWGLQLSIKRGILGPPGRVALSLLCGSAFLLVGNWLISRKRYAMMGQGLLGGGIAMLYFAFFSAHVLFNLIAVLPAFGLMIVVTAVAVVMALRHQSLSIAVLGTIGGFATPVMLQTEQPNLTILLAYLILLGFGMAAIAIYRQWPLLVWLSLLFSTAIVAGTLGASSWDAALWPIALGGVTLLFVLYSTAIFGYAVRHKIEATPLEAGGLFVNALFFLSESWWIFDKISRTRSGMAVLTLALACFYIVHIHFFFSRKMHDRTLLTVFAALAAVGLALTLPCLFSAEALTASWAILATALLWVSCRLLSQFVFNGALLLYCIAGFRALGAFFDSAFHFTAQARPATYLNGLTDRLIALGIPVLCAFVALIILRRRPQPDSSLPQNVEPLPLMPKLPVVFTTLALAGAFLTLTLEAKLCFAAYWPDFSRVMVTVIWVAFLWYIFTLKTRTNNSTLATLCVIGLVFLAGKWLLFDTLTYDPLAVSAWHYRSGMGFEQWVSRLLNTGALLGGLALMHRVAQPSAGETPQLPFRSIMTAIAIGAGFFYLTFESATFFHAFVPAFEGGAISLFWGLYALALLWVGLRIDLRSLRLTGLALFAVADFKVVFVDLVGLDIVWRLLAFGVLGVAMLLAAFAYLKKNGQRKHNEPI